MKTFEDMMQFTRTVSGECALTDQEARILYDAAWSCDNGSTFVEVGCQYGRSSSLLLQIAKEKECSLVCIDPFLEPPESAIDWLTMMRKIDYGFTLHCLRSEEIKADLLPVWVDLLYIDGDHLADGVRRDCDNFLPLVKSTGKVCFHDYWRESLPGVTEAVDEQMVAPWQVQAFNGTMVCFGRTDR